MTQLLACSRCEGLYPQEDFVVAIDRVSPAYPTGFAPADIALLRHRRCTRLVWAPAPPVKAEGAREEECVR